MDRAKVRLWRWLILAVYCVSFLLPMFYFPEQSGELGRRQAGYSYGWAAFVAALTAPAAIGLIGSWSVLGFLAWCANVYLCVGWMDLGRNRLERAKWLGVASVALALLALPILFSGEGNPDPNCPLAAYWTWLASMITLAVVASAASRAIKMERSG
jgi:hypothetical protein